MSIDRGIPYHQTSVFASKVLLIIVLFFAVLSFLFRAPDLTLCSCIMLLLFMSAEVWSRRSIRALELASVLMTPRVFAGDQIQLQLSIHNRKWLPTRLQVTSRLQANSETGSSENIHDFFLTGHSQTETVIHFQTEKRGVYRLEDTTLQTTDIFGFFPRQFNQHNSDEIIVFPAPLPIADLSIALRQFFGQPGKRSPVEDPIYISGNREYRGGAPAKRINWKTSARLNRLSEKVCEPTVMGKVLLLVDVRGYSDHDQQDLFERMLSLTGALLQQYSTHGHQVGLLSNGKLTGGQDCCLPPGRRVENESLLLEQLARLQDVTGTALAKLLERCSHLLRSTQVIILCRSIAGLEAEIQLLRTRGASLTLVTAQPEPVDVQKLSGATLIDMESLCL